jgi:hypothetical protein
MAGQKSAGEVSMGKGLHPQITQITQMGFQVSVFKN